MHVNSDISYKIWQRNYLDFCIFDRNNFIFSEYQVIQWVTLVLLNIYLLNNRVK